LPVGGDGVEIGNVDDPSSLASPRKPRWMMSARTSAYLDAQAQGFQQFGKL
jgi:hypothetical protein